MLPHGLYHGFRIVYLIPVLRIAVIPPAALLIIHVILCTQSLDLISNKSYIFRKITRIQYGIFLEIIQLALDLVTDYRKDAGKIRKRYRRP